MITNTRNNDDNHSTMLRDHKLYPEGINKTNNLIIHQNIYTQHKTIQQIPEGNN